MGYGIFDYVQLFVMDTTPPPGGDEIPDEELPPDENSPDALDTPIIVLSIPTITITGNRVTAINHPVLNISLSSAPTLEGNEFSVNHTPIILSIDLICPEIYRSGTGLDGSGGSGRLIIHDKPSIALSFPDIFVADIVSPVKSIFLEPVIPVLEGDLVAVKCNTVPSIQLSTFAYDVRTHDAPTWFTGRVVTHSPIDILIDPSNDINVFDGENIKFSIPEIDLSSQVPSLVLLPVSIKYTFYQCVLTGDNDDLDDLIIPISSFQSRLKNGTPTYLSVVVPNALGYVDDINDRSNGEIVINKQVVFDNDIQFQAELVRTDFEVLASDTGAVNSSIRLSGHKTVSYANPKTLALSGVSVVSVQDDGKQRVRCSVNFFVNPGDTATWGNDDSMTIGMITITVGDTTAYMDITEA